MDIGVVSLFPEMFRALETGGVTARAIESGRIRLEIVNPRDFATGRHRCVDDRPYGGGPGMVLQVAPLRAAVRAARRSIGPSPVTYLSPQGKVLDQSGVRELAARPRILLLCGRYEGVDERLLELEVDEELSLGDYVLSGGELAAMVVVDVLARELPGVLGHEDSAAQDSFATGLLDHPHYTRPGRVAGLEVPEVLRSGDHEAVRRWRMRESLRRTAARRPDLLARAVLDGEQREMLAELQNGVDEPQGRE